MTNWGCLMVCHREPDEAISWNLLGDSRACLEPLDKHVLSPFISLRCTQDGLSEGLRDKLRRSVGKLRFPPFNYKFNINLTS